jgi:hypothetical protein
MELRDRQSRVGGQENASWRNRQKCRDGCGRSYLEVLTTADIQLGTLLGRRLAAGLGRRHFLRAALRTHLAAAFILARTHQLLRHETREPWRPKQGQQCRDSPQSGSRCHPDGVYPSRRFEATEPYKVVPRLIQAMRN